jgi:hypothetical protein
VSAPLDLHGGTEHQPISTRRHLDVLLNHCVRHYVEDCSGIDVFRVDKLAEALTFVVRTLDRFIDLTRVHILQVNHIGVLKNNQKQSK